MQSKIDRIFEKAFAENRELYEHEAKTICKEYGMKTPDFALVNSLEKAIEKSEELGYPIVLKIVSPQIIHKSDAGGVLLNLKNSDEVKKGYKIIINNIRKYDHTANIKGILVQKMAPPSYEVIIGTTNDPQFGPTLMLGMGGIYVEVYKDVTFRVAPIEKKDAIEMVNELKGSKILKGYRGKPPTDINAIIDLLIKISNLIMSYEVIDQVDLNPILVYEKGLQVVDARIILNKKFT